MSDMSELRWEKSPNNDGASQVKTFSCIGAGKTGSSLCRLLSGHLSLNQVINPTVKSAKAAVELIGSGEAIGIDKQDFIEFKPADLWMITCPDDQIQVVGNKLIRSGVLASGNVIFHCCGSLSSSIWDAPDNIEIKVASVHPIHSFAEANSSLNNPINFHCAIEGDIEAMEILTVPFKLIGATLHKIDRDTKSLYHASTVMACNYLVSLLELSHSMLQAAGIEQGKDRNILRPLIKQTLNNYLSTDAKKALTGPISRGDIDTVSSHLLALENQSQTWRDVYISLGKVTLDVAEKQGSPVENLNKISSLLEKSLNLSMYKDQNEK